MSHKLITVLRISGITVLTVHSMLSIASLIGAMLTVLCQEGFVSETVNACGAIEPIENIVFDIWLSLLSSGCALLLIVALNEDSLSLLFCFYTIQLGLWIEHVMNLKEILRGGWPLVVISLIVVIPEITALVFSSVLFFIRAKKMVRINNM